MMKDIHELLMRSFEEKLSEPEQRRLENALKKSKELQLERDEIIKMRSLFQHFTISENPTFTKAVLKRVELSKSENVQAVLVRLFPRIAAACILFLLVSILGLYLVDGGLSMDSIVGLDNISEDTITYLEF